MKNFTLAFVCFHFIYFSSFAQKPKIEFGKISQAELDMKIYPKDSSAEAVILYDFGEYTYDFTGAFYRVIYQYHQRIKILKKSGFSWANVQIPFSSENGNYKYEFVKNIKGATYNLENGVITATELMKSSIFEEKISATRSKMKIAFPQVKEGSVIEYSYTIESPFLFNLKTWNFQQDIPVVWSELKAQIPSYFDFKFTYFGYNPFAIQKITEGREIFLHRANDLGQDIKDPFTDYQFAIKDLPTLKEDDFMTTVEDYRSSIDFQLARTNFPTGGVHNYSLSYQDLTKTLLEEERFGVALKKFSKSAKIISELILTKSPEKDTLSLVKKAYEHIRQIVSWNEENRIITTGKLEPVLEKGRGNSTEINLILVAVLRELGFDANPVVLSTRSHGKVLPDIALLNRFNYTIAQMTFRGKDFLLDASDKFVKPNMLPKKCLNGRGWLISKNPRWVNLAPTEKKQSNTVLTFAIEGDQKLKGNFKETYLGYAGSEKLEEIQKLGEAKYIEKLKTAYSMLENPQFSYKIAENGEPNLECQTIVNEAYSLAGNRIYFQPLLWKTTRINPYKQADRKYPIDLAYQNQEKIIGKFTIPKNYSVESLPTNVNLPLSTDKGKFFYSTKVENGIIEVTSQVLLAKTIYTVEDYADLRDFFDKIVAKQNEQIVLKKN